MIEDALKRAIDAGYHVSLYFVDLEDMQVDLDGGDCNCYKQQGYSPKDEGHGHSHITMETDRHPEQAIDLCLQLARNHEGRKGGFQCFDYVWNKNMTHAMEYERWMKAEIAKDKEKK